MSRAAAVYVLPGDEAEGEQAAYALSRLAPEVARLVVVTDGAGEEAARARFGAPGTEVLAMGGRLTVFGGYRAGLRHLLNAGTGERPGIVAMTGTHALAPVEDRPGWLSERIEGLEGVWSHAWIDLRLDDDLGPARGSARGLDRLPAEELVAFGPQAIGAGLLELWEGLRPTGERRADLRDCAIPLFSALAQRGVPAAFGLPEERFETAEPAVFECHAAVREGRLVLPRTLFHLDPLLHDVNATDLRGALEALREINPALHGIAVRYALSAVPSREFCTIADQYEVLPVRAADPAKTAWSFGTVAVFVHAFYPEMMDEFWERIDLLPCESHLFISTSREEHAEEIRAYLAAKGWPEGRSDVRVVAQNRGRDMSALFITFRDVVLSGRFEVALRLHSKRTPQVSRQVGEGFKAHLFDNLAGSRGYVSNLLDMLEAEPDIGLVVPPLIHVGFGTLGHAWFNNRRPLERLAARMGIEVPLDPHTPVTAFGTMFWFRTAALRRLFEWPWSFEDYNAEPHHIDGGLAHVQERLIGVCTQASGFRTLTVMDPRSAARGYAKLEYKHQMLAAHLSTGSPYSQGEEIRVLAGSGRMRLFRAARDAYGEMIGRYPRTRRLLRPTAHAIMRLLGVIPPSAAGRGKGRGRS